MEVASRFVGPQAERVTIRNLLDMVEADYELKQRRSLKRVRLRVLGLLFHWTEHGQKTDNLVTETLRRRVN